MDHHQAHFIYQISKGEYEIELLNVTGQLIDRKETKQTEIINTLNMPDGIYFLKVCDKRNVNFFCSKKFVIQH